MTRFLYWLSAVIISLLLTAILASCNGWAQDMIAPPKDWPKVMHIAYSVMGDREIYKVCGSIGCAFPDPVTRTCMIFLAQSHQTDWVAEHERKHCEGYTHE